MKIKTRRMTERIICIRVPKTCVLRVKRDFSLIKCMTVVSILLLNIYLEDEKRKFNALNNYLSKLNRSLNAIVTWNYLCVYRSTFIYNSAAAHRACE